MDIKKQLFPTYRPESLNALRIALLVPLRLIGYLFAAIFFAFIIIGMLPYYIILCPLSGIFHCIKKGKWRLAEDLRDYIAREVCDRMQGVLDFFYL